MANEQNLKPFVKGEISSEEAARRGRNGGKKSGETRRRRKAFSEAFNLLLEREFTDHNGTSMQGVEIIAAKVFRQAMDGDMKAVQFLRDTVGEMPVQTVQVAQISAEDRAEMDELLGLNES